MRMHPVAIPNWIAKSESGLRRCAVAANGDQWQGADPSQVQAMTPKQQVVLYQHAETERSKVHDEIMQQIRRIEGE